MCACMCAGIASGLCRTLEQMSDVTQMRSIGGTQTIDVSSYAEVLATVTAAVTAANPTHLASGTASTLLCPTVFDTAQLAWIGGSLFGALNKVNNCPQDVPHLPHLHDLMNCPVFLERVSWIY